MSKKSPRRRLIRALEDQRMVRVHRSLRNADPLDGFVVGVGSKWVLMAMTRDGGFFDGLAAFRIRDVWAVDAHPSFEGRFARTLPEWPPRAPEVTLDRTSALLDDLGRIAPLISIGQEDRYKFDGRWIGARHAVRDGWLWLWEVRPDASWKPEPLGYKLSRITIVEIDSSYLFALDAIAGRAPQARASALRSSCGPH